MNRTAAIASPDVYSILQGRQHLENPMFGTRAHRRYILPSEAAVFVSGRFGRRRARTTECWAILRAEECYTSLIRSSPTRLAPGHRATMTWKVNGRDLVAGCEVRPNAVWRYGRVFLICPKCGLRCARLYAPTEEAGLACRLCWGLTYASRSLLNYKDTLWGRGPLARLFNTSQRDMAYLTTSENRAERQKRSAERWEERRKLANVNPAKLNRPERAVHGHRNPCSP